MDFFNNPLASDEALQYVHRGWSVIPIKPKDKHPLNGWKEHQRRVATVEEVASWIKEFTPSANVGICTGETANLVVVDVDNPLGMALLVALTGIPETPTVKTNQGHHFYFSFEGLASGVFEKFQDTDGKLKNLLEIKATGQYVVAPPSVHPTGTLYRWEPGKSPQDIDLAPLPSWIEGILIGKKTNAYHRVKSTLSDLYLAAEGTRNEQLNKTSFIMGTLIKTGSLTKNNAVAALQYLGHKIGLDSKEILDTINSGIRGGMEKGTDVQTEDEVVTALLEFGKFSLNQLTDSEELNDDQLTDVTERVILYHMHNLGFKNVTHVRNAITFLCTNNVRHPIKDYFNKLEWDGHDWIKSLAAMVVVENQLPGDFKEYVNLFHLVLKKWLLGAVERVYLDGRQHFMLVLDGPQRVGKSYFARWLASGVERKYFYSGPIQPGNKDSLVQLMKTWIWEVGELGSTTRKADREALKAFLTLEYPEVRKPYGRHSISKPALASFIGTINDEGSGFLNDPTGTRRFAVLTIKHMDWTYSTEIPVDQVWAQAVALYRDGESSELNLAELELRDQENEKYQEVDSIEEDLMRLLDLSNPESREYGMYTTEILDMLQALGYPRGTGTSRKIGAFLKRHGYGTAQPITLNPGERLRGYYGVRAKTKSRKVKLEAGALWEE